MEQLGGKGISEERGGRSWREKMQWEGVESDSGRGEGRTTRRRCVSLLAPANCRGQSALADELTEPNRSKHCESNSCCIAPASLGCIRRPVSRIRSCARNQLDAFWFHSNSPFTLCGLKGQGYFWELEDSLEQKNRIYR